MDSERVIRDTVQSLAGTLNKSIPEIVLCTVVSVDENLQTIDASPLTGNSSVNFEGAFLGGAEDEANNGFLLVPKIGSIVGIVQQTSIYSRVVLFSEIDKIQMLGGSFGGLVKVEELTNKINVLEKDLNDLKTAFTNWVVVPADGGGALKAITSTWSGQTITETEKEDIENIKITHGAN